MPSFLVWQDLAGYSGPSFSTTRHSHFFSQLCLGNGRPFRLRGRDGRWRSYDAAFIPSGVSHQTEESGHPFTILLADPLTTGAGLFPDKEIKPGEPAIDVSESFRDERTDFGAILEKPGHAARSEILDLFARHAGVNAKQLDYRIFESIERMRTADPSRPLGEYAAQAGLSAGRFRHLFREHTGVAFSAYRLWLKMRKAVAALGRNPALVDAAYEGGFADQAHFSRVFRRSFGMSPTELRGNPLFRVQIF